MNLLVSFPTKKHNSRGYLPVNKLDTLCLKYDLFFNREKGTTKRHEADKILADGALQRVKSHDAPLPCYCRHNQGQR